MEKIYRAGELACRSPQLGRSSLREHKKDYHLNTVTKWITLKIYPFFRDQAMLLCRKDGAAQFDEHSHPAIIAPEVFDAVQVELKRRKAPGRRNCTPHCFTGYI